MFNRDTSASIVLLTPAALETLLGGLLLSTERCGIHG
jgi:hypothetical protein